jgi:hypothetical protein
MVLEAEGLLGVEGGDGFLGGALDMQQQTIIMPRHSRNPCTAPAFSRREITAAVGGATRLSTDALRPPHYCSLSLTHAAHPVISAQGHLFDKAAISEYYLTQLEINKHKLLAYQKQIADKEHASEDKELEKTRLDIKRFQDATERITSTASTSANIQLHKDSGFWAPHQSLVEHNQDVQKPDMQVKCPMSGKPLKVSKLIPCIFTPLGDDQFMCPLSRKQITHSTVCVVLKSSGNVISKDSLLESVLSEQGKKMWHKKENKELKKGDESIEIGTNPFDNKPITLSDVIVIKKEGNRVKSSADSR